MEPSKIWVDRGGAYKVPPLAEKLLAVDTCWGARVTVCSRDAMPDGLLELQRSPVQVQHWMDFVGLKWVHKVRRGKWSGCIGGVGAEGAWYEFDRITSCMKFLKNKFLIRDKPKREHQLSAWEFFFFHLESLCTVILIPLLIILKL